MQVTARALIVVSCILALGWALAASTRGLPSEAAMLLLARSLAIALIGAVSWFGTHMLPKTLPSRFVITVVVLVSLMLAGFLFRYGVQLADAAWTECAQRVGRGSPEIPERCGYPPSRYLPAWLPR